jgi:hypothetical protein
MHSLSIIIGPRTALGRTLCRIGDPSEIIVLIPRSADESEWLAQHYPWFIQYCPWDASSRLPDTRGPVRIMFCAANPQTREIRNPLRENQMLLDDLTTVKQLMNIYRHHRIHLVLASNSPASPYPQTNIPFFNTEAMLERLCGENGNAVLSVLHAGRLFDTEAEPAPRPMFATSLIKLARIMINRAQSDAPMSMTVGIDARWMALKINRRGHAPDARGFVPACLQIKY